MPLLCYSPLNQSFEGVASFQAKGASPTLATYPAGVQGAFELIGDYARATVLETDAATFGNRRAEFVWPVNSSLTGLCWYSWEFMIDTDWQTSLNMTIAQVHDTPDGGDPLRAVPFLFQLENGRFYVRTPLTIPTEANTYTKTPVGDIVFGKWYRMGLRVDWQLTAIGSIELYIDEVAAFKQANVATVYNDAVPGYLKIGVYDTSGLSGWVKKSINVRKVRLYEGLTGYPTGLGFSPSARQSLIT